DGDEQPPRPVLRPARPGDEARTHEHPAAERSDDAPNVRLMGAREPGNGVGRAEESCGRADCQPEPAGTAHAIRLETAAPESSAFGMNPAAPLVSTSGPKSAPSRLETSTTQRPLPFAVRRRVTS